MQHCLTPLPTAVRRIVCVGVCRISTAAAIVAELPGMWPGASARRGEKGSPRFRSRTIRLLLHLVLWSSPGPLGQHRPRIKVRPVRSYAALRSSSPRAALAWSRRWCRASYGLGLPLRLFQFPPRHPGLLLQGPALRTVLLHPSQVMPYHHRARDRPLTPTTVPLLFRCLAKVNKMRPV